MKKYIVLTLCLLGMLYRPVSIIGQTKHCGTNKEPYDPNTEGCCLHADGTGEKTDNPENADMDAYADQEGLCLALKFGVTFCYNGEKRTAICPYGKTFPDEYRICIQMHEDSHKNDNYGTCRDCDSANIDYTSAFGPQNSECDALNEMYKCLGSNDSSSVNWMIMKSAADARYQQYGCTFDKGMP